MTQKSFLMQSNCFLSVHHAFTDSAEPSHIPIRLLRYKILMKVRDIGREILSIYNRIWLKNCSPYFAITYYLLFLIFVENSFMFFTKELLTIIRVSFHDVSNFEKALFMKVCGFWALRNWNVERFSELLHVRQWMESSGMR